MADTTLDAQLAALPSDRRALYERMMAKRQSPTVHELSVAQRGLWFLDRLVPKSPLYAMTWRFELRGRLDTAAFRAAVSDLIDRHEALRTRFGVVDQRPVQLVDADATLGVPIDDVRDLPVDQRTAAVEAVTAQAAEIGFDLAVAPLFRLRLVRVADERYVAILGAAHILVDGISSDVFIRDLQAAYDRRVNGSAVEAKPAFQFGQFVAWQHERMTGPTGERLLAYWRRQLEGAPGVLELPTGRTRTPTQTFAGAALPFVLPADAVNVMREVAEAQRCSLFMSYLATVGVLLSRYTGRTDICIGTPVANRTRREHMSMIGLATNMVVIRINLAGDPTFRQLLDRVRDVCLDAYGHQEMPFDRLVDTAAVHRNLAYNPLFQIACALAENTGDREPVGGITAGRVETVSTGYAKFDLSLPAEFNGAEIAGMLEYGTAVLDEATAARLAGHLGTLWREAGSRPDVPLSRLSLRSAAESGPPPAGPAFAAARAIGDAVAAHAALRPDTIAVSDGHTAVVYRDLDERAWDLAGRLTAAGVGAGATVTVRLPRGVALVVALLALSRIGAGAVIVPPGRPDDRRSWQASATLSAVDSVGSLPAGATAGYAITVSGAAGPLDPPVADLPTMTGAYACAAASFGLHDRDTLAVLHDEESATFVAELVAGLVAGAHCRLVAPDLLGDPAALRRVLDANAVSAAWLPRRTVAALDIPAVPSLRLVITDPGVSAEGLGHVRVARVHTVSDLGPWAVVGIDESPTDTAPVVAALPGIAALVLDSVGQPMPIGLVGDLYLPPAHGSSAPAARIGLRALRREDGRLELHGATAEIVDVDGVTVSPDVLERVLSRHGDVREAYVTVAAEPTGVRAGLTAFIVPATESQPSDRDLLGYLADELPQQMMPDAIVIVERLPLTADGHVDRSALPWPHATVGPRAYVAPRNALERLVVSTWCELFERDQIGIDANFFDLGGHSLLAVRLLGHIGELFGAQLPVSVLFGAASPEGLAARLIEPLGGEAAAHELAASIEEILQMSEDDVQRHVEDLAANA